jgi:pimeloyl-ACP methyl ester carboxylesterase
MESTTSRDGTTIAFDATGSGPTLVLVGGALSERKAAAGLAAALAPHFRAVSYDRRGRGDSADTQPYAVERELEDLTAVIAANGGEPAFVYGKSSGGALALAGAAAGLPIRSLAILEPPFRAEGAPVLPADYVETLRRLVVAGRSSEVLEYFMTVAVGLPAAAIEQSKQQPFWTAMETLSPTLVYDGLVLGDNRLPLATLANVAIPALVIDSTGSAPWLRATASAIAAAMPNARHMSLDGGFHDVSPEILAPVLTEFFMDARVSGSNNQQQPTTSSS